MSFQIFISYARKDDLPPLSSGSTPQGDGFVKTLRRHLEHFFADFGPPEPVVWRDRGHISDGDQFQPLLDEGIAAASMLLVVLSKNWLASPNTKDELTKFAARWNHEGEDAIRSRIVYAVRRPVKFEERPPELRGAKGFEFFREDSEDGVVDFFHLGATTPDFVSTSSALAEYLHRRAELAPDPVADPSKRRDQIPAPAPAPAPAPSGPTIYVAKTASDIAPAYVRVVDELQGRGYRVVPEPGEKLCDDESCVEGIDEALRAADLSIHILGQAFGSSPENLPPIAKLQLARAGECVSQNRNGLPFRRIIWAPKVFVDAKGNAAELRDPFAVLERFGERLETDTIDGSELSKFIDFIAEHLANRNVPWKPPKTSVDDLAGLRVYLYFDKRDREYALSLAAAFKARGTTLMFPSFEDDPQRVEEWHRQMLGACDAVVVCWADAGEVWVKQQTPQWKRWEDLGRQKSFAFRGVIFGPPSAEGDSKHFYLRAFQMQLLARDEVDVVVDLSQYQQPPPESLDPIFGKAAP